MSTKTSPSAIPILILIQAYASNKDEWDQIVYRKLSLLVVQLLNVWSWSNIY
jgi:hypothetical protein